VLIRADSGGGTHDHLTWLAKPGRRLAYSVGFLWSLRLGEERKLVNQLASNSNAVSLRTSHRLQFPASDELLYDCLASRPPTHRLASQLLETRRPRPCRRA